METGTVNNGSNVVWKNGTDTMKAQIKFSARNN